ncbi:DUF559 domain-containing protein [Agromyces humatus]|uniref:DUF559 domain-containing protein n=1 Tax=Agromyces humatus TaxID=279573 RepID=A0ABN2KAJ3_9MICO|nr:DUF559 domain-containing protein [Agromyces humatus]
MGSVVKALGASKAAHRRVLRDAGIGALELREAIGRGDVKAVRRDWIVGRKCDPMLERALYSGATLACVSAAAVHGLWSVDSEHVHVSAGRHASRLTLTAPETMSEQRDLAVHWTRNPTAGAAIGIRASIDGLPRVLVQIARCQPVEQAVAVCDSALVRCKVSLPELRALAASDPVLRRVVEHVHPRADSGVESIARVRLARRGVLMVPQIEVDGHRVDGMIGQRLLLQFDGFGPHSSRAQRNKDLREDQRLVRKGYLVVRFSRDQVMYEWAMIESTVLSLMAQGRHNW